MSGWLTVTLNTDEVLTIGDDVLVMSAPKKRYGESRVVSIKIAVKAAGKKINRVTKESVYDQLPPACKEAMG